MSPLFRSLGRRRSVFQNQNSSKHSAIEKAIEFLPKPKVNVFDWPNMSPDLNPRSWEMYWNGKDSNQTRETRKESILLEWKNILVTVWINRAQSMLSGSNRKWRRPHQLLILNKHLLRSEFIFERQYVYFLATELQCFIVLSQIIYDYWFVDCSLFCFITC